MCMLTNIMPISVGISYITLTQNNEWKDDTEKIININTNIKTLIAGILIVKRLQNIFR